MTLYIRIKQKYFSLYRKQGLYLKKFQEAIIYAKRVVGFLVSEHFIKKFKKKKVMPLPGKKSI